MLRFHIKVSTKDSMLRRSVRRLMAATSSSAEFVSSIAELGRDKAAHLYVADCRGEKLTAKSWTALAGSSKVLAIVDQDAVPNNAALLRDPRFTSVMSV